MVFAVVLVNSTDNISTYVYSNFDTIKETFSNGGIYQHIQAHQITSTILIMEPSNIQEHMLFISDHNAFAQEYAISNNDIYNVGPDLQCPLK